MFSSLMMGFAMIVMSAISDVRLYGIEDNVTLYIGAEIPIYAEADHPQGRDLIQWVLNQPTYLDIQEQGNQAVLKPKLVGAVDVMARLDDGSYSSRSIYVKTQYFNAATSEFNITNGMKPIKQYGIDKKTFQVEVDERLSTSEKVNALKNYLIEIQTYGKLQLEVKAPLLYSHQIYTLGISGYPNRKIEVRLDVSDAAYGDLVFVLENLSLLNSFLPEVEKEDHELQEDARVPIHDEIKDDKFESIKEQLLNMSGHTGSGSSELPFQFTLEQLLSQPDIVSYLNEAWRQGKLDVSEVGHNRYRLRLQSLQNGSANELYIEVIDSSSDVLKEEEHPDNSQITDRVEPETDVLESLENDKNSTDLKSEKESQVLMEMTNTQANNKEVLKEEIALSEEPMKQSILTFNFKNYYVVAGLILFVLLSYGGYLMYQIKFQDR